MTGSANLLHRVVGERHSGRVTSQGERCRPELCNFCQGSRFQGCSPFSQRLTRTETRISARWHQVTGAKEVSVPGAQRRISCPGHMAVHPRTEQRAIVLAYGYFR